MNRSKITETLLTLGGAMACALGFLAGYKAGMFGLLVFFGLPWLAYWLAIKRPGRVWGPLTWWGVTWLVLASILYFGDWIFDYLEYGSFAGVSPFPFAGALAIGFVAAGLAGWKGRNPTTYLLAGLSFGVVAVIVPFFLKRAPVEVE